MASNASDKENKEYLDGTFRPILEKLIPDLLFEKPKELLPFLRKWLDLNESFYSKLISIFRYFFEKRAFHTKSIDPDKSSV